MYLEKRVSRKRAKFAVIMIWTGKEFCVFHQAPHSFQSHGYSVANRRAYRTDNRISRSGQLIFLSKRKAPYGKAPHGSLKAFLSYSSFLYRNSHRGKSDFFRGTCFLAVPNGRSWRHQVSEYYDVDKISYFTDRAS